MEEYDVQITETSSRIVTITANSSFNAEIIAKEMYYSEEIVLDYTDYDFTEFELINKVKCI